MKYIGLSCGFHDAGLTVVDDKGGAIKGNRLDVRMTYHWQAREWGMRWLEVDIGG